MTEEEAQAYVETNKLRVLYLAATPDNLKPDNGDVMVQGRGKNVARGSNFIEAVENIKTLDEIEAKKNSLRQRMVSAKLIQ